MAEKLTVEEAKKQLAQLPTDKEISKTSEWDHVKKMLDDHGPKPALQVTKHTFIGSDDNEIYILDLAEPIKGQDTEETFSRVVVRIPSGSPGERPHQHNPEHQKWALDAYSSRGIPVPNAVFCSTEHDFLIESCVPGTEMVHLPEEQGQHAYVEIGALLKKMHSVATKKFGHFGPEPGVGTDDTWDAYLQKLFLARLKVIEETKGVWDEQLVKRITDAYLRHKDYLVAFDKPVLVHGDMNTSNVFLKPNEEGVYCVSGIIDFADSTSGDPLFDLGGLLLEINIKRRIEPEFSDLDSILEGYGALTEHEQELVKFYALVLMVFYLCEDMEVRIKRIPLYTAKVEAVLKMMRN